MIHHHVVQTVDVSFHLMSLFAHVCQLTKVPHLSVNPNVLLVANVHSTRLVTIKNVSTLALVLAVQTLNVKLSITIRSAVALKVFKVIHLLHVNISRSQFLKIVKLTGILAFHLLVAKILCVKSNRTDPFAHASRTLSENHLTADPNVFLILNALKTKLASKKNVPILVQTLADQTLSVMLLLTLLTVIACQDMKVILSSDVRKSLKLPMTRKIHATHLHAVKMPNAQSTTMLPNVHAFLLIEEILIQLDVVQNASLTQIVLLNSLVLTNTVAILVPEFADQMQNVPLQTTFQFVVVHVDSTAILSVDVEKKFLSMFHPQMYANHLLAALTHFVVLLMEDLLVHV